MYKDVFILIVTTSKIDDYSMGLKYQNEIDNFNLDIKCPDEVSEPNGIDAFRFSYNPIGHPLNFLPNVVFDRQTNGTFNYKKASDPVKCKRCGASYYTSLINAKSKWEELSEQNKQNLGYTHIANGILAPIDGLMKEPDKEGHFGFYEYENVDLAKKFKLVSEV